MKYIVLFKTLYFKCKTRKLIRWNVVCAARCLLPTNSEDTETSSTTTESSHDDGDKVCSDTFITFSSIILENAVNTTRALV